MQPDQCILVISPVLAISEALVAVLRDAGLTVNSGTTASVERLDPGEAVTDRRLVLIDGSSRDFLKRLTPFLAPRGCSTTVLFGLEASSLEVLAYARLGVAGLVAREASIGEIVAAIEAVRHHGVFMSPAIRDVIVERSEASQRVDPAALFTKREYEVATLAAAGLGNKQIAHALQVKEATVKIHVRHVMAKLKVRRRADVAAAMEGSWIRKRHSPEK